VIGNALAVIFALQAEMTVLMRKIKTNAKEIRRLELQQMQ
jgi:hypothetical protein